MYKRQAYEQRAATHEPQDWGKTFIEVDLSEQYMWYIVDGNVAFETAVVTGKPYAVSYTHLDVYKRQPYYFLNMVIPFVL